MKTTLNRTKASLPGAKAAAAKIPNTITAADVSKMLDRYGYPAETREIIESEKLLPTGVLSRLHATYPQHSGLLESRPFLFNGREQYSGIEGLREVIRILARNGIQLGHIAERELFVEVYRFKASRHILNTINWDDYERDSMFQLVFPQPGMMRKKVTEAYLAAKTDAQRRQVVEDYMEETNPHDGKQLLNKPWIDSGDGGIDILEGSQHKYPPCQLIFDQTTQNCFAFCTYCFRHAQVRGDHDMFIQEDIAQVHQYLRLHPEVTDILITGGDAGYLPLARLRQYVMPIIEDPALLHIRAVRLGSRMLTYQPELVLSRKYDKTLELFDTLRDNGVQLSWMAHFSTPRELLNPSTLAAIRRLQNHGVVVRSQSPIMNHVSLFMGPDGKVDVERSAANWIDLAHILAALSVRFHAMYCARPTGEYQYFTASLADIDKVFSLIYRSLASLHRPSRYITMTTSAGKLSILGTAEVNGQKAFALKFNESRNMAWMDKVFLAKYDPNETKVDKLAPLDTPKFFFEDELASIEDELAQMSRKYSSQSRANGKAKATPKAKAAR
jgi:L-lysine 2,3-aminomutase